jgi:predicted Zn-dependent protease
MEAGHQRGSMARRLRSFAWAVSAVCAACCPGLAGAIDESEQRERIEFQVRELERQIEQSGSLLGDLALDAYLQSIIERLYPENRGRFRILAYRDPEFNAFAVATGNLYINTGALLRMRDEAELAAVVGHEGGHVLADHMYRSVRNAKNASAFGLVLSVAMIGVIGIDPGLGAIASYSSMAGFSRDNEREADQIAYQRMVAAGYDPTAGIGVFDRMAREMLARDVKKGPYFFASHPDLEERVKNFTEFSRGTAPGERRRDEYLAATAVGRAQALQSLVERKDGRTLVFVLEDEGMADTLPPDGHFALGEGYRLRARPGDEELALAQYRISVERFPDFAPAWGALGRYYGRKGDKAQAIECLEKFLALAPDAREAPFARQALQKLKSEATP